MTGEQGRHEINKLSKGERKREVTWLERSGVVGERVTRLLFSCSITTALIVLPLVNRQTTHDATRLE